MALVGTMAPSGRLPNAAPLGQRGAARYVPSGATPLWAPRSQPAARPFVVSTGSSSSPFSATCPSRPGKVVWPAVPADPDSPKDVATQSTAASTEDEGFFRKRYGEGKSSGGGPSSLTLSQSWEAGSFQPAANSPDVHSVLGSSLQPTRGVGTIPHSAQSVPLSQAPTATSGVHLPRSDKMSPAEKEFRQPATNGESCPTKISPRLGQVPSAQESSLRKDSAAAPTRSAGRRPKSLVEPRRAQKHDAAIGTPPRQRGASPEPGQQSPTKAGRCGEGRSSGGGPSRLSLGSVTVTPDQSTNASASPGQRLQSGSAVIEETFAAPQSVPLVAQTVPTESSWNGKAPATSMTVQENWMPSKETFGNSPKSNGKMQPSYEELLAENRQLREELADTRNELAAFRRWYSGPLDA